MLGIDYKSLIGKLNPQTRGALDGALGLCVSRTHYDAEIEHYLTKLAENEEADLVRILRAFDIDRPRFVRDLGHSLDKLKTGNARTPSLSPTLLKMFTEAWSIGSLNYASAQIRTGFTVLALVSDEELARLMADVSREWLKIKPEELRKEFFNIVVGSKEDTTPSMSDTVAAAAGAGAIPKGTGKTPFLDQYATNLTEKAKSGKVDPVLGRDHEIRQIIDILMRRRQNNPILTGEAGVGKTAVVEGFAARVASGDVPPPLKNVSVRSLDLALLQAGAGVKGEFENRLKGLIEEVKSSPTPIIVFIDEAHTLIGAGGAAGQGDAANLLKPALARGEMRTVAATTWSEYKKYFEKDPALARRFQVVKVEEPDEEQCKTMLRGVVASLEKHHNLRILDDAVNASVSLSHRYLAGRQLPDKAVSVLDTACARLALGQNSTPPAIEDATRQLEDIALEQRILEREVATGADHTDELEKLTAQKSKTETELKALQARFDKERDLVSQMRELRTKLETLAAAPADKAPAPSNGSSAENPAELRTKLSALEKELDALQGETPLIRVCVDKQTIGEVISNWTGIPVGKMVKDEIDTVLHLADHLHKRVIGQDYAMQAIAQRIMTSRASMDDPSKPVGVFMLIGPSGVGKTETALALSDLLYGGERNLITINMSEFQEAHTVSTLKGSPPGYVGYGEGGVLTEAVRRRPYSVVLLDEVEKAHPDVLELFYQVFDKGMMEDGEGREINFKNNIIILTTNACTDQMMKLTADPETSPTAEGLVKALKPELDKIFKPAFLGRMMLVPYYPVRDENLKKIVVLKLNKIVRRMAENQKIELVYDEALVNAVAARCTEVESGARNVDNILTNSLLPDISKQVLARMAEGTKVRAIHVSVGSDGNFAYEFKNAEARAVANAV
ncbi:MAG TPA: type VI secretion system ATPase TssH [Candidatus Koribacter sp.]|jgi:type VI secretion system protein VasG